MKIIILLIMLLVGISYGDAEQVNSQTEPYVPADENQLLTLGAPNGKRFELPLDLVWPENPGEADICLWKDDKFAAASITIDDNCKPDHDWWLQQCEKHGIKVTWFVVTGGVGKSNPSFNGNWGDWQKLVDAGCAVESHTTNHKRTSKAEEDFTRKIFAESQYDLNTKLTNNTCLTIAYPMGDGNHKIAGEYFIAARGVHGGITAANAINYLNTQKGGITQPYIDVLLTGRTDSERLKWLNKRDKGNMRGWIMPLYHYVPHGRTPEEKNASKERVRQQVENLASYKDRIWIDTFPAVALYAQERDSATLTSKLDGKTIKMTLTDRMKDDIFNVPLTIKVRLPDEWKSVKAQQGGKSIEVKFIRHEGVPYALVYAVPDRGEISVEQGI